jgi:multidrug efflux system outer membrane protein
MSEIKTVTAVLLLFVALGHFGGCAAPGPGSARIRPDVSPSTQPTGESFRLDRSQIAPMYRELLAIDLSTVVSVAAAQNIDIRQARQRVRAAEGRYESSLGAIFPVFAPSLSYEDVEGSVRAVNGPVVPADFNSFAPVALVQWVINPGKVVSDIIAARKRLLASEQQEQFVVMETIRASAVQYYDLMLAQAKLSLANRAVAEAEELLRITRVRLNAGAGLPADDLRAQAALAGRQQDLALALNAFYQASVALAVTLHLDSAVTLVPKPDEIAPVTLVREDLTLDQCLGLALEWRTDLQGVRSLIAAAAAETAGATWGALAPQVQAGYQYGGISSHIPGQTFGIHEQKRFAASAGWALGLSTFGQVKTANAGERQARLEAERQLDQVRAQVVRATEDSRTNKKILPMARQQLAAAEEALRLTQANLQAGTMLTLDVLQAEDAVNEARLRYAQAVARYNQSQLNLLEGLGLLDVNSVIPSNSPATAPASAYSPSAPSHTAASVLDGKAGIR